MSREKDVTLQGNRLAISWLLAADRLVIQLEHRRAMQVRSLRRLSQSLKAQLM